MTNKTTMYQFCRQTDESEHDGFCVLDIVREFVGYTEKHEQDILKDCRRFIVDGDQFGYKLWALFRYELTALKDGHVGITKDKYSWFLDPAGRLQEMDFDHQMREVPMRAEWMPDEQHA